MGDSAPYAPALSRVVTVADKMRLCDSDGWNFRENANVKSQAKMASMSEALLVDQEQVRFPR